MKNYIVTIRFYENGSLKVQKVYTSATNKKYAQIHATKMLSEYRSVKPSQIENITININHEMFD